MTNESEKITCTVVVSSFDGFADCWDHFYYSVEKYWPDCPWPIVLLAGREQRTYPRMAVWPLGEDRGWAGNMITALNRVQTDYVLYLQEDYWLSQRVKTDRLAAWLQTMRERNWQYLRLNPCPPPERLLPDLPGVGECTADSKYRVSLQAAFWQKDFFLKLLCDGENGWDFEAKSRERLQNSRESCFGLSASPGCPDFAGIDYCAGTAVRRGQWTLGAVEYAEREGLTLNSQRTRESRLELYLGSVSHPLPGKILARTGLRLLQIVKGQRRWYDFFR